ncbi:MAG: hypothetical protein G8D28_08990 [gamma proteobacterium symbiont of Phacoides pectinatus]
MRRLIAGLLVVMAGVGLSQTALAGDYRGGPGHTPAHHKQFVRHGGARGLLSAREVRRLERQQRHLRKVQRRIVADGQVSRAELETLWKALRRAQRCVGEMRGVAPRSYWNRRGGWRG